MTVDVYNASDPGNILITRTLTRPLLNYESLAKSFDLSDNFYIIGSSFKGGSGSAEEVALAVVQTFGEYGRPINLASMESFFLNSDATTEVYQPGMFDRIAALAGLPPGSVSPSFTDTEWYTGVPTAKAYIHFTDDINAGTAKGASIDIPGEHKLWYNLASTGEPNAEDAAQIFLCVLVINEGGVNDYYKMQIKP
jgi:hypothetical protein